MKVQILNHEGKKTKEMETELFSEPVRIDIISKVVEAEKIRQPYSPKFRAGMDRSASGNVGHRRHDWKSDRGRGMARIPKKAFWRRGTQFNWEGAIVPFTRGGRRAHPPKGNVNLSKVNKKEFRKALLSSLRYVSIPKEVEKKYSRIEKVEKQLPLIVEDNFTELKTKSFLEGLKNILGELNIVAIQQKKVRAGIGKMRGRKYKKNAGVLVVVSKEVDKNINGVEIVKANELNVSDLASNGARLTIFSEGAIKDLENSLLRNKDEDKKKEENKLEKVKEKKVDKRKVKKEARKKKVSKTKKESSEEIKLKVKKENKVKEGSEK